MRDHFSFRFEECFSFTFVIAAEVNFFLHLFSFLKEFRICDDTDPFVSRLVHLFVELALNFGKFFC